MNTKHYYILHVATTKQQQVLCCLHEGMGTEKNICYKSCIPNLNILLGTGTGDNS